MRRGTARRHRLRRRVCGVAQPARGPRERRATPSTLRAGQISRPSVAALGTVQAADREGEGRAPVGRAAPRQRRAALPDEGLQPRRRSSSARSSRSSRTPRATPTRSGCAARRTTRSSDYLAARRDYRAARRPRQRAALPAVLRQGARASRRRVAPHSNEPPETLDAVFAKLNQVPPAQVDAALLYAKGKGYYSPAVRGTTRSASLPAGRQRHGVHATRPGTSTASSR